MISWRPVQRHPKKDLYAVEPKELRDAGLKVTLPRLKILEMLEHSATKHPSAEQIYRQLLDQGEDIGLATV